MMGQMMSLFQQMQIERERERQERDRERQEAMAREERLAAESREDRSLLKSLLGQSQSSMTTTHTPSQPYRAVSIYPRWLARTVWGK